MALHTLDKVGEVARAAQPACTAITVGAVRAAPGYGTKRMVYSRKPHELEYFAHHSWADTPATMLQSVMVDALEKSGRFEAVLSQPGAEQGALQLDAELRTLLQQFNNGESRVLLEVRVSLFGDQKVIGSRLFEMEEAGGNGPESGVVAANHAAARFTSRLVEWVTTILNQSSPKGCGRPSAHRPMRRNDPKTDRPRGQ